MFELCIKTCDRLWLSFVGKREREREKRERERERKETRRETLNEMREDGFN